MIGLIWSGSGSKLRSELGETSPNDFAHWNHEPSALQIAANGSPSPWEEGWVSGTAILANQDLNQKGAIASTHPRHGKALASQAKRFGYPEKLSRARELSWDRPQPDEGRR
jgi:hypothetical protein